MVSADGGSFRPMLLETFADPARPCGSWAATISPQGATMIELPIWSTPSSFQALETPITQLPFW